MAAAGSHGHNACSWPATTPTTPVTRTFTEECPGTAPHPRSQAGATASLTDVTHIQIKIAAYPFAKPPPFKPSQTITDSTEMPHISPNKSETRCRFSSRNKSGDTSSNLRAFPPNQPKFPIYRRQTPQAARPSRIPPFQFGRWLAMSAWRRRRSTSTSPAGGEGFSPGAAHRVRAGNDLRIL